MNPKHLLLLRNDTLYNLVVHLNQLFAVVLAEIVLLLGVLVLVSLGLDFHFRGLLFVHHT